jgi:serine/threonine protein kinase
VDEMVSVATSLASEGTLVLASPTEAVLNEFDLFPEDKYEPIKVLKSTLQGKVIRARAKATGEEVAIKMSSRVLATRRRSSTGRKVLENCYRELVLMEFLRERPHPNVIRLVEAFADEKNQYLVLEFADKGELYDIVDKVDSGLPEDQARHYFKGIVEGVKHIHSLNIAHLDLSLENVFVNSDDVAKIGDFGVAREFKSDEPFFSTTGIKPGKQNYIAPEITETGFYRPNEADVFSLGVMLFIMTFGFPPFEEASEDDLRWQYIKEGRLNVLLRKWEVEDKCSAELINLIEGILCPVDHRLRIDEILSHPWLANHGILEMDSET